MWASCKSPLGCWNPFNYSLLEKKNIKGAIVNQKGTRIVEDGEDLKGLATTILKNLGNISSKSTNDDVASLTDSYIYRQVNIRVVVRCPLTLKLPIVPYKSRSSGYGVREKVIDIVFIVEVHTFSSLPQSRAST